MFFVSGNVTNVYENANAFRLRIGKKQQTGQRSLLHTYIFNFYYRDEVICDIQVTRSMRVELRAPRKKAKVKRFF